MGEVAVLGLAEAIRSSTWKSSVSAHGISSRIASIAQGDAAAHREEERAVVGDRPLPGRRDQLGRPPRRRRDPFSTTSRLIGMALVLLFVAAGTGSASPRSSRSR